MRAVNLLPREDTRSREAPKPASGVVKVAAVGGGVVVLALAAGFVFASRGVNTQRANLQSAQTQLAVTPRKPSHNMRARAKVADDRDRRAVALATALSQRVSWDRVLRRLALVLPDDIWLTSLAGTTPVATTGPTGTPSTSAPAPTPSSSSSSSPGTTSAPTTPSAFGATPTGLTLEGYAYSQAGVARLLSRLQVVPDLKNVQLETSKSTTMGGRGVVQFTILSDINYGSDAA
jgi:Tfp pilus assembly protein PilN